MPNEQRVALITGAAAGIGRSAGIRLGAEGAAVVLGDIDETGTAATVEQIVAAGGKAVAKLSASGRESSCT